MTTVNIPETSVIENKTKSLTTIVDEKLVAWGNKITCQEMYEQAGQIRSDLKLMQKHIVDTFKEPRELAYKLHKSLTSTQNKFVQPLEIAENKITNVMAFYVNEQRRIADELARKEREEAERLARETTEIERKRIENERLKQAEEMEKLGYNDEVETIINTPIDLPVPVVQVNNGQSQAMKESLKTESNTYRIDYDFEVADFGILPNEYKMADEVKIRKVVKALGKECKIAGIRVIEKTVIIGRR